MYLKITMCMLYLLSTELIVPLLFPFITGNIPDTNIATSAFL